MSPEEYNMSYGSEEIARYHKGEMDTAEMYALEMAALDDPFLQDALEGYVHTTDPSGDIAELKRRLQNKKDKKRSIYAENPLLKIAAILILIAGFSWLIFNRQKDPQLSSVKKEAEAPLLAQQKEQQVIKSAPFEDVATDYKKQVSPDIAPAIPPVSVEKITAEKYTAPAPVNSDMNVQEEKTYYRADNKPETDFLTQKVSPPAVPDSSEQYIAANAQLKDKESSMAMEEAAVVSSAYNKKAAKSRMATADIVKIDQAISNNRVKLKNAIPLKGYDHLNSMIADSLRTAVNLNVLSVPANVKVIFQVSKENEARKIQIVRSACNPCNIEAERFIQSLKWKRVNRNSEATITF